MFAICERFEIMDLKPMTLVNSGTQRIKLKKFSCCLLVDLVEYNVANTCITCSKLDVIGLRSIVANSWTLVIANSWTLVIANSWTSVDQLKLVFCS